MPSDSIYSTKHSTCILEDLKNMFNWKNILKKWPQTHVLRVSGSRVLGSRDLDSEKNAISHLQMLSTCSSRAPENKKKIIFIAIFTPNFSVRFVYWTFKA